MTDILNNGNNETNVEEAMAPAAADDSWVDKLPEDLRQVALNKGWREPSDALKSYRHLEEFMGAEKSGRGIVLPKGEDDAEGYARLYQALGRPENARDYGLEETLGQVDLDPDFMGAMGQAMHQAGLSKKQAGEMALAWQGQLEKYTRAEDLRYETEKKETLNDLSSPRLETAKRGFRSTGLPAAMAEKIERSIGPRAAVEMFARIGEIMAEDRGVGGPQAMGRAASPEGARRRMDRLMADPAFSQRYLSGDNQALEEISELARRATEKR